MLKKTALNLKGKTVLVTGGTGSFGNAVVERLLKFNIKKVFIFSRDEKKQFDMRNKFSDKRLDFFIGDVRNRDSVDRVIKNNVNLIFHAAALKQVPACEFFPTEAVYTNVLGSANVISSAIDNGVDRVVILSTDKAVYPINAMGQTKALMEKIMIANSRIKNKHTILCGVRYGNVMCSRGSVIPFFLDKIKNGDPLTVTNGKMTRFLLSMDDAVDLILYALLHGKNGHIFVKKAPACTIETMAEALIKISGHQKGVKEIGIRPGEKIHETLISCEEFLRARDAEDYYIIPPEAENLDYEKYFGRKNGSYKKNILNQGFTSENTKRLNLNETIKLLLSLKEIKEFQYDNSNNRG